MSSIAEAFKKALSKSEDSKEGPVKTEESSKLVANAEANPEPPTETKVNPEEKPTSSTTTAQESTSTTDQTIPDFSSVNLIQKHLFNSTATAADMLVKSEDFQSLATIPPANYIPRQTTGSSVTGATDTVNHSIFNSSKWMGGLKAAHEDVNYDPTAIFKSTAAAPNSARDAATLAAAAVASASEEQRALEGVVKKPPTDLNKLLENKLNPFGKKPPAPSLAQSTAKNPPGNTRKRKSSASDTPKAINYIKNSYTDNDVLMGKGGRSNHHPGNQRYLKQKLTIQPRYKAATKEQKTSISQELVDAVHSWGGRFLKLDEDKNMWYEVDNKTARKKASQTLREDNTAESRAAKRAKYQKEQKALGAAGANMNAEV